MQLLMKIKSNCEYLSFLDYAGEPKSQHGSRHPHEKEVCSIAASRMIVQMTYLLYTCSLLKIDILLSIEPLYYPCYIANMLYAKLAFCFSDSSNGEEQS